MTDERLEEIRGSVEHPETETAAWTNWAFSHRRELLAEVDRLKAENERLRRVCTEASITIAQLSPSANITVKESDRIDRAAALLRTAVRTGI